MPEQEQPMHEPPQEPVRQPLPHTAAHVEIAPEGPDPAADGADADEWAEDPDQLPARPRRRFLTPVPVALLVVLMTVCGFIAGVLVEKGQGSTATSTAGAAGLASRFAALRGGATGGAAGASGLAERARSFFGGGGAGGATTGQVTFIQNGTLYVSTAEGGTVKVTTSKGSTVTRTVKGTVAGIHPGETVIVTGSKQSNGSVEAESIRVSEGEASGLGSLFGGGSSSSGAPASGAGGSSGAGAPSGTGSGSSGKGEGPALFGPG